MYHYYYMNRGRKDRCKKGKSCGLACIKRANMCLIDLGKAIKDSLTKLSEKIRVFSNRRFLNRDKIQKQEKRRDTVANGFYKLLSQDRGDGKGTHLENPNEKSMKIMQAFHRYTERVDARLNRLEGRRKIDLLTSDGKVVKIEQKRWYPDKFNLAGFKDLDSKARKEYEERIIQSFISKGTKSENPQAIIMAGAPASGKTTLLRAKYGGDPKGFVLVDMDSIKSMLPEFEFGRGIGDINIAGKVHETSKRIATEILRRTRENGLNLLYDGTGGNEALYTSTIKGLKSGSKPYNIQLLGQHLPKDVGVDRAVARAELPLSMGGGRFVPRSIIDSAYVSVPGLMLKYAGMVDNAVINDSLTGKPIAEFSKGKVTSANPKAYRDYLDKFGS